jgi:hypothetical protein
MLATYGLFLTARDRLSVRLDRSAREDYRLAWYVVPLLVAMVFCMLRGKRLATTINIGGGQFLIGCA